MNQFELAIPDTAAKAFHALCSSKRQGSLQNITFNDYPAPLQIAKTTSLTILHKQCYHQITNLLTHTTKHLDAHTCDLAVPQDI